MDVKLSLSLFENNLLLLPHEFFALFEAIGLALDVDNGAMVENRRGNGDVCKDLVPMGEGLVGGENRRRPLIASGDELKEQIGPLNIHR